MSRTDAEETRTALDMLEALHGTATAFIGAVHGVIEAHQLAPHYTPPREPLPAWALGHLTKVAADAKLYYAQRATLREALRLAAGDGSSWRFECWQQRAGTTSCVRLERRVETMQEAKEMLEKLLPDYPGAFIARVHVHASHGISDPALLDTLIGRIEHHGTYFPETGLDQFEVMDETGRTVLVPADVLAAHPAFQRMRPADQEAVEFALGRGTREQRRARAEAMREADHG